jgi:hypothetical protein
LYAKSAGWQHIPHAGIMLNLKIAVKIINMETKTVTQTISLSRNYTNGDDTYQLRATLTWINGKFDEVSFRNDICGVYLFYRSNAGSYRLSANGLIAFRELMQEVVTTTNNPPVGCESV